MRKTRLLRATVLAVACSLSMAVSAQSGEPGPIDIPPGDLVGSLQALTRQSGAELAYREDLLTGLRTQGVRGTLTAEQALEKLLEGSGFTARRDPSGALMILKDDAPAPPAQPQAATRNAPATSQPVEQEVQELQKLTVTGTRIRGGSTPSPVITIGSERIQEEGFADLGEVIRSVSQNFSGGQNPGVAAGATLGASGGANQNVTGGSSLNLRGLGPDASLTLLNGRRMAYGGFVQAVDVSAIPVEAVERIEIVADGASAIYGSDAVGGVANVILKRDVDGFMLGARYGTATDGGLTTREYTATAGAIWSSGGLIATYKDASVDPIFAEQRTYTDQMAAPTTIYPGSDVRSGLLSAHQTLGDAVELRLDALRTERDHLYYYVWSGVGNQHVSPKTTTSLMSPSIEFSLPNDWVLSVAGTLGKDKHLQIQSGEDPETGISTPLFRDCYCNESRTYEIGAEGPLFTLRGGDARLAVGAGYRMNDYLQLNYLTDNVSVQGDESSRFAYAEINLPWIGLDSNVVGVQRLVFTLALRGEDYDSFGRVTTPKLGLIYGPSADITLKASWGRSFKAPTLYQRYNSQFHWLDLPENYGGAGYPAEATVLLADGGNLDLKPERARTSSASLAFHPAALPGLEVELTWFDIDYTDRVIEPITDWGNALNNPNYAEFIEFSPSAEEQAAVLANADTLHNVTGAPYDPNNVVAIVFANDVNATRQRIKGLDLSGSYRFDLGAGRLTIRGSATWLDISQQTAGTPSAYDLTGTVYNPAKANSRIGGVWNHGGFTASAFANYTSGATNTLDGKKTASFTTVDGVLRYSTGDRGTAWSGLEFTLTAQNMFNRPPPLHATVDLGGVRPTAPYDSTNYSAIGRFLSLSMSKHW